MWFFASLSGLLRTEVTKVQMGNLKAYVYKEEMAHSVITAKYHEHFVRRPFPNLDLRLPARLSLFLPSGCHEELGQCGHTDN